jgi:hypothetical protein
VTCVVCTELLLATSWCSGLLEVLCEVSPAHTTHPQSWRCITAGVHCAGMQEQRDIKRSGILLSKAGSAEPAGSGTALA